MPGHIYCELTTYEIIKSSNVVVFLIHVPSIWNMAANILTNHKNIAKHQYEDLPDWQSLQSKLSLRNNNEITVY